MFLNEAEYIWLHQLKINWEFSKKEKVKQALLNSNLDKNFIFLWKNINVYLAFPCVLHLRDETIEGSSDK